MLFLYEQLSSVSVLMFTWYGEEIHFWYSSKLNTKYELIYLQNLTGRE